MADIKFSQFTATTTAALTDQVVGLQGGVNKRTTLQKVRDLFDAHFVSGGGTAGNFPFFSGATTLADSPLRFNTGTNAMTYGTGYLVPSHTFEASTAGTNSVNTAIVIYANSTGTATTGFGSRMVFGADTSTGTLDTASGIGGAWEVATTGSVSGALVFFTRLAGGVFMDRGRVTAAGNLEMGLAIKTGNPASGTAALWKLGSKVSAAVSLVTTDYIQIDIAGVAYKLALVN